MLYFCGFRVLYNSRLLFTNSMSQRGKHMHEDFENVCLANVVRLILDIMQYQHCSRTFAMLHLPDKNRCNQTLQSVSCNLARLL